MTNKVKISEIRECALKHFNEDTFKFVHDSDMPNELWMYFKKGCNTLAVEVFASMVTLNCGIKARVKYLAIDDTFWK